MGRDYNLGNPDYMVEWISEFSNGKFGGVEMVTTLVFYLNSGKKYECSNKI